MSGPTQPAADGPLPGCRASLATPRAPGRDYALWASWACGIAAALLLTAGIALYLADGVITTPPAAAGATGTQAGPAPRSIVALRQEFDDLVKRSNARQVSTDDLLRQVSTLITEARALLARPELPETHALHAQKLIADAYEEIADYPKEFEAFVDFAERLARYYRKQPQRYGGETEKGLAVGDQVILDSLLARAARHQDARKYLPALAYYERVNRQFPAADSAAYSLYQMGQCFLAYDLTQDAEACHVALAREHPSSAWVGDLLRAEAQHLRRRHQYKAAAEVWLRIAGACREREEKARCEMIAAGLYAECGRFGDAERMLEGLVRRYAVFAGRAQALQMMEFCRKEHTRLLADEARKSVTGM